MVDAILQIFTAQKAVDLQVPTNMSERQLIEALKHLRPTFGRGFIQPRISHVLGARKDLFLDLFSSSNVQKENHHGQLVPKTVIYCLDLTDFIDRVCSLRGLNKAVSKIKVRIDYGKLFLKVSLTISDDYYNNFESCLSSPSGSAFKLSGAKKTMLLAVGQAPETHFNLQENVS